MKKGHCNKIKRVQKGYGNTKKNSHSTLDMRCRKNQISTLKVRDRDIVSVKEIE